MDRNGRGVGNLLRWLTYSLISAFCITLLGCVISIPLAWGALEIGLSTSTFLLLGIFPFILAIGLVQRQRIGERVAGIVNMEQVSYLHHSWRRIQQLANARTKSWVRVYSLVELANKDADQLEFKVQKVQRYVGQLRRWAETGIENNASDKINTILREIQADSVIIDRLAKRITQYNGQIIELSLAMHANSVKFAQDEVAFRLSNEREEGYISQQEIQDYTEHNMERLIQSVGEQKRQVWSRNRQQLTRAMRSIYESSPTVWTFIEIRIMNGWIKKTLRTNATRRRSVIKWLNEPRNPYQLIQIYNQSVQTLGELQIRDISLARLNEQSYRLNRLHSTLVTQIEWCYH